MSDRRRIADLAAALNVVGAVLYLRLAAPSWAIPT